MTFVAVTKHANKYKALFELLFHNLTTACFIIDKKGITLKEVTVQNLIIDVVLPAENFETYNLETDEPIHVGLGIHVNQFLKTIKNKSVLKFSITTPYVFDIQITTPNDDCVMDMSASIASMQNIAVPKINEYSVKAISIGNTNFSKMCRAFRSPTFYFTKKYNQLEFSCMLTDIYKKTFIYGERDPTDNTLIHKQYRTDQFIRIIKLASFAPKMIDVYAEQGLPLTFKTLSEIGTITVTVNTLD